MTIITAADLAAELGTDARTVRKFLRSITPRDDQPGKGARWGIESNKRQIAALRKKFAAFEIEVEAKRREREAAAEVAPAADETPAEEIDNSFDSLEGPSDEELAELEG